jgi:DUF4097 and DUF4098 domain-containing protein YvlB
MQRSRQLRRVLPLLACSLATGSCLIIDAPGQRADGSFARTLTVSGPADIDIQTGSGDIEVRLGQAGTVRVEARIRAWAGDRDDAMARVREVETNPPVEQNGPTIRLGLPRAERRNWNRVSIGYTVTVPPDTRLRTRSGSGDQVLAGVQGDMDASTGSGNLRIGAASGLLRASSGSGDIVLNSGSGGTEVRTGSGDVFVNGAGTGRTGIGTSSGDVRVSGVRGPLSLHTASGDIDVEGTPVADWSLAASSGDITVHLTGNPAFDLRATSSSGRIQSDAPVDITRPLSRRALEGEVRGGGPAVEISTASGNIQIR